ncbi:MAG: AAA family ATPase [Halobacteriovoraceae bacterium]|nr:AAA family ATPase [Halobacteriovoraceae bacterium]
MSTSFICNQCSYNTPKWTGKCPSCNSWNSFLSPEELTVKKVDVEARPASDDFFSEKTIERRSGIREFDRVLPSGLVEGSVTLLSGEPGVGKSTLLAQVLGGLATKEPEEKFLYVSGEENLSQIGVRFKRLNVNNSNLYLINQNDLESIKDYINACKPRVVIIDSIQVLTTTSASYSPGSVNLVKLITEEIVGLAKMKGVIFILIGQKTKDGALAGPKHLEHMVDTVLSFENGKRDKIKVLRATKNRFGSTDSVGFLKMFNEGFSSKDHHQKKLEESYCIGKCISVIPGSDRFELVEVEALVTDAYQASTKRMAIGFENNRLALMAAIMEKYLNISFQQKDIYIKINCDAGTRNNLLDLPVILALLSSLNEKPLYSKAVGLGEVSLTGAILKEELSKEAMTQLEEIGIEELHWNGELIETSSITNKALSSIKEINYLFK